MTLNSLRSLLYRLARLLGDVQALRRGRIVERTHNRIAGRIMRKVLGKIWR
jgi:hypothetical protein